MIPADSIHLPQKQTEATALQGTSAHEASSKNGQRTFADLLVFPQPPPTTPPTPSQAQLPPRPLPLGSSPAGEGVCSAPLWQPG